MLHREATDGAKRCLLDYTLERTSSAESECEGLLVLVSELNEGGAAGNRSQVCNPPAPAPAELKKEPFCVPPHNPVEKRN